MASLVNTVRRSLHTTASAASIRSNCRKVVCIGRNYADHVAELNNQRPKQPMFFLKPPSSILPPSEGPVLRPSGVKLHYEVELGLVMGKEIRELDPEDQQGALDAISSYVLAIDMTARNVQDEAKAKGLPWSVAKGFDTFCPISEPVPKDKLSPDPHAVELWLNVNGEARQDGSAQLMLFRIPRLLSDIAKVMRIEPGDLILTGTPKGVGEVKTGDVMTGGMRFDGKEVEEARMEVKVEDSTSSYEFKET